MGQAAPQVPLDFSLIEKDEAWYTVVTKFNYEMKFVSELLKKLMSHKRLLNDFVDLFIPERKCTIEYTNAQGKLATRIITDKTMSLYVFIKVKMSEDLYWLLKGVNGCSTVLATGNTLTTVPEEEVLKYRDDADIKTDTFKGFRIVSKVNPFYNPINALKGHIDQQKTITVKDIKAEKLSIEQKRVKSKRISKKSNNLKDTIKDDKRDLSVKRTKAEGMPKLNEIDPELLFKKLRRLGLMNKFMQLSQKDISFLSGTDLTKLQGKVRQAQVDDCTRKPFRKTKVISNGTKESKKQFKQFMKIDQKIKKQCGRFDARALINAIFLPYRKSNRGKYFPIIPEHIALKHNFSQTNFNLNKHPEFWLPYVLHQKHKPVMPIITQIYKIDKKKSKITKVKQKSEFKQQQSKNNWKAKKQGNNFQTKSKRFKNKQLKLNQQANQESLNIKKHQKLRLPYKLITHQKSQ